CPPAARRAARVLYLARLSSVRRRVQPVREHGERHRQPAELRGARLQSFVCQARHWGARVGTERLRLFQHAAATWLSAASVSVDIHRFVPREWRATAKLPDLSGGKPRVASGSAAAGARESPLHRRGTAVALA